MIGAYASAAIVCAASLLAGRAILGLWGREEGWLLGGPVGLAALLTAAGIVTGFGGEGDAVCVVLGALCLVSGLWVRRPRESSGSARGDVLRSDRSSVATPLSPMLAAGLALLLGSLPFIASGDVGLLGVGLVNDDMASHLLLADWLDTGFRPEPVFVDQGYPLGPHSLVVGLAALLGTGLMEAFAGMLLAVPMLTALAAFGALEGVKAPWRPLLAPLVALPYLVAAYFAQEAFKEPILALFVLSFALLLPGARGARAGVPLGVLAAGAVYVYSFPGLAWLAGTVALYGAWVWAAGRRRGSGASPAALPALLAGTVVLLLCVAPELDRLHDFVDFRALDADRANEGGLGNLRGHISPLEALGLWPTSEFRLSAGSGGLPAAVFYLGGLLGLLALAAGLPAWVRRHGPAVPAALLVAAGLYLGARAFGTVYTSAKALAIAAPLVALVALGGLAAARRRAAMLLAGVFALGVLASSFLILRQSPVAPTAHAAELERIRPLVEGESVLFLGRDNFVLYELRGSRPYTHVRNFYDPFYVQPNYDIRRVASKFDFDSIEARKLDRFPFVITTGTAYQSEAPPEYERVLETSSYRLWQRSAAEVAPRTPGERGPAPAGPLRCRREEGGAAVTLPRPSVVGPSSAWTPSATVEAGRITSQALDLPAGRYAVSLSYDATRPLTLEANGTELRLPANLDYRGVAPYWPAGEISVEESGMVRFDASVERPPLAGRLLGADSVGHLNGLVATPVGRDVRPREISRARACGELVDWYRGPG